MCMYISRDREREREMGGRNLNRRWLTCDNTRTTNNSNAANNNTANNNSTNNTSNSNTK